uniref:Uncharacterized protein n=1 Tax=Salix viminalis TaxID=40686 RepID=A0A6N2M423_SALVM
MPKSRNNMTMIMESMSHDTYQTCQHGSIHLKWIEETLTTPSNDANNKMLVYPQHLLNKMNIIENMKQIHPRTRFSGQHDDVNNATSPYHVKKFKHVPNLTF